MEAADTASPADHEVDRYREAMRLIVEDDEIQAGAATFRGTRILVHQIVDLLGQGADEAELFVDYPRLTRDMIAAALVFARAHPDRGRAHAPSWRTDTAG
jgi:uncharacterized protein (DUF433 family)